MFFIISKVYICFCRSGFNSTVACHSVATDSGPHDMCVCDDNSQTHTFYITAVELGDVNITVRVSVAACYKK